MNPYPRDMIGYGANPPDPKWPGGARIAVQIVMNYEEGSEYSIPDGDESSEMYLTEVPGATLGPGKRDLIVESVYEYGSRAGLWRLMRMFEERSEERRVGNYQVMFRADLHPVGKIVVIRIGVV